jgi:uncharacterized protein
MALLVNLRHLAAHSAQLRGELSPAELDIDTRDEVIQVTHPLQHQLEVQRLEGGLLLQGHLRLVLDCQCVRCLKPFQYSLDLKEWACHVPLEGEERAVVVNDCVDLTPYLREDILLEFPRHPLCDPQCRGLSNLSVGNMNSRGITDKPEAGSPAWAELNKLKF